MACEDPYEGLPEHLPTVVHMSAGAVAGIIEHSCMYPVDMIKTRMQCLRPCPEAVYNGVYDALRTIVAAEGIGRIVRGLSVLIAGAGPAHALYFTTYEQVKFTLTRNKPGHHPLCHATAGVVATLFHDTIMNPIEVVKQRMQVYNSPFSGICQCAQSTLKAEGVPAFYRSFPTQLLLNIPFQCIHFVSYEYTQNVINPNRNYNPLTHIISGGLAGGMAAAITTPLDVMKTLLNTQERLVRLDKEYIMGMRGAFSTIRRNHGFYGFWRGFRPRVIYQIPSTALTWSVYEFFKNYLISSNRTTTTDRIPSLLDGSSAALPVTDGWHIFGKESGTK